LRRQAARFPAASLSAIVASLNTDVVSLLPSSVPPPSMSRRRLPQCRRRTISASLGSASLDGAPSPPSMPMSCRRCLPRRRTVASLNVDAALSLPPSVQPPSMPHRHLPQHQCRTVTASLDTMSSPPSTVDSLDFILFCAICWYCFGCDCIIYWINQLNYDMRCSETRT
jgi:hypothetical protein